MKIIDGHEVIEHAEVNGESREFIRILMDYIEDAPVVEPKTSDLISRKALLKQIDIDSEGQPGWYGDTWRFIDTIKNMPSYEPTIEIDADQLAKLLREGWTIHSEPKQGEWMDRSDGGRILNPWYESYECNECGQYGSSTWTFCPNCGCRMKGADDED